ncbi:hypothetical protein [Microbacterium oleivorans]|uniref:Uncharacterized protein n=1 Tax=Microbacterium oleivorans TaxID=273677 RepID=A0A7D5ISX4_9MICO|nr:hypothetical protein [Microbacterium oleivorans]QLD11957.1 hypothetical protein HW566_09370 [Microbacterium oleivorans]
MEWSADVSAGDWLRDRLDDPWAGTIHDVVPRGFEAYARVLHPASVQSRASGDPLPPFDEWFAMGWERSQRLTADLVTDPATWADTAAAFGTTLHPLAQWDSIVRSPEFGSNQMTSPDGRWFAAPGTGELDPHLLAALAGELMRHTSTPDDVTAGLWEGRGGLIGHTGRRPSRAFFQIGDPDDATLARHNRMLGSSFADRFNSVFRKPSWQEGILSREISEGPRLRLPERPFILFRGALEEFADDDWELRMPWRDLPAEAEGAAPMSQSPSLLWPADRAWAMVSEVDFDSTIVGGSRELVAAICRIPDVEALPLPDDARLYWGADEVNR